MSDHEYDETPQEAAITTGDQCADDAIMAGKNPAPPPKNYEAKYPFAHHYDEETAAYEY